MPRKYIFSSFGLTLLEPHFLTTLPHILFFQSYSEGDSRAGHQRNQEVERSQLSIIKEVEFLKILSIKV